MKLISASFIAIMLLLTSCETTVINRGYVVESADFSKIKVGKDDARVVFTMLGSPTIRSTVKDENGNFRWYYVYKKTEKTSFLDPKIVDHKTMIVTFNSNAIVVSVTESTYEKSIAIVTDKTKTEGKTGGIASETFGGLGKYMKRYTDKK